MTELEDSLIPARACPPVISPADDIPSRIILFWIVLVPAARFSPITFDAELLDSRSEWTKFLAMRFVPVEAPE